MRRKSVRSLRQKKKCRYVILLTSGVFALLVGFNQYVDQEIRPTLMKLAEYEARAITIETIHKAINSELRQTPDLCEGLYEIRENYLQMNTTAANRIRSEILYAVETAMQSLPEQMYEIPFGSLTGNALLSGHGPVWQVAIRPEGYVEAEWAESSESLSINTTRYAAELWMEVTVNMILDGRTETLTVKDSIPMTDILLTGDIPSAYASSLD